MYYKDGSIQIVDPSTGSFVAFTTRIERGEELATVASPITPTPPPTPKPVQIPSQKPAEPELISSGTGFVVSSQTYILTNEHVVRGCQKIRVRSDSVELIPNLAFRDRENDLALLKLPPKSQVVASFRAGGGIRPGDWILGVGFPLRGLLASEANITVGVVSALAGIGNDHRFLQISTPVQSGNSGGPLLDQSGNVIGVIFAKLDAVTVAKLTGDIPQNVNFAIKGRLVEAFLEANGVDYKTRASTSTLKPADIAQRGRVFTVPVECWK